MRRFFNLLLFFIFISLNTFSNFLFADEVDDLSKNFQKENKELLEITSTIQQAVKTGDYSKLKALYKKKTKNSKKNKKDMNKISNSITKTFRDQSFNEVSKMLDGMCKNKPLYKYTKKGTKVNLFLTKVLRDKTALPSFFSLSFKKNQLYKLSLFSLGTILFNIILKFFLKRSSFLIKYPLRWTILYAIRIELIIFFIGDELSPIWNIFKQTFL